MTDIENVQEAYSALKRVHVAANETNDKLQAEIKKLQIENAYLQAQLINADKMVMIQKKIVEDSLRSSQEKHERDYQEILELKKKI
jgi:hypothetical protein